MTRDIRRPGRWDDDRRTPRPGGLVDGDRVRGRISGDAHERAIDGGEQIEGGGRILTRRLGQRVDTDHAGLIDAKVELPPATSAAATVFRGSPLTCSDDGQPRAVEHEMEALAERDRPQTAPQMLTAPGERRRVGGGEVEAHHPEQCVQEPFGLAQREMVEESQDQGGLDGEIRVALLPTPPAAPAGRPGSDRLRGQPHRHIAASNEGLVIGRPVRNAVLRLVRGMDLRLHPCSVAPAEGPEKCAPPHRVFMQQRRAAPSRPRLHAEDRLILVFLARLNTAWRDALHVVKPDTLLRWHRDLFTLLWHHTSRRRGARGRLRVELIDLIQAMATANGLWGAERIRGDLLKLGIRVSKRTVQQYMRSVRPRGQHGQTWGTFLRNHTHDIWACDVLQLYDAWFRPIYAFLIVAHGTREVVHVNVTRSPTDAWVAQQLREATPYDSAPRFLIRDNDGKFGRDFAAAATSADIDVVPIPPRSPNLNAICERFLGGLRRECLDYVLLLGEDHLRRVLAEWVGHFNGGRPHQGIGQRIPNQRQRPGRVEPCRRIVAFPVLGGLHHDYRRAA